MVLSFHLSDSVSVDMLSLTGRTQAFDLGESFAEHYGFTLLDTEENYTVEFAGRTHGIC
jgi:hypothetical protein